MVLCDVLRVQLRKNQDLLLNVVNLIFGMFEVNNFDCYGQPTLLIVALVHFSKRALLQNMSSIRENTPRGCTSD